MRIANLIIAVLFAFLANNVNGQSKWDALPKVEIYQLWEVEVKNNKIYTDPLRDVTLKVKLTARDGKVFNHSGFYDGNNTWKIRFSPDESGEWNYEYWFNDDQKKTTGEFGCIPARKPGRVMKNSFNPFWLGQGRQPKTLFKSFHVGDRFFATNWDDPANPNDGNARTLFLDWATKNGYNMLSIASCFTNRNDPGRGKGWDTPRMWPVDPAEYRKAEVIMDELKERGITVFPFAGIFGQNGEWPVNWDDQQFYIRYFLARFGHYPNLILNIAGPEPFWAEKGFKNAMLLNDIKRIGAFIDSVDVHNHVITVHNETRASEFGCPFIDEPWCDMATIQGPKTFDSEKLFSGLIMNHRPTKAAYANETLWAGNVYHPAYTNDRIRKNTYTILFSGSILNFADNNGISSTGFSGTMDLKDVNQEKHDIVSAVHNWFASIPFSQMTTRQDLVKQGYCLAKEGEEYYIYMDTLGKVELYLDYQYPFQSEWINAKNPADIRKDKSVQPPTHLQHTTFETPSDGDDWILHVYAARPTVVATGNFPDLAVDQHGNIHLVYNRSGLMYRKYDTAKKEWSKETAVGCECVNVVRSDPDVVVDSNGYPHVYCGNEYAWFDGKKWNKVKPKGSRDSELAINRNDQLFLTSRGGNFKGHIGMETRKGNAKWSFLPDPDENGKSVNDHVYTDLFVSDDNTLHLIQRHGPVKEVTYRRSTDGGLTWPIEEAISDDRGEAPKIVVDKTGKVFVSTAQGYIYERPVQGGWKYHGRKVTSYPRQMPELGIDQENNLYVTSFGGMVNTLFKGRWMGEKKLIPVTNHPQIGFVETAGARDFTYIVWEEGKGHAEEGLSEDASIVVGILFPDGRVVGLE
jgi:hypothetical protein